MTDGNVLRPPQYFMSHEPDVSQCLMNIFETEEEAALANAKAFQFVLHAGWADVASLVENVSGPITQLPGL